MRQQLVQVLRRPDESVDVKDALVRPFWSPIESLRGSSQALPRGQVIDLTRWVSERRAAHRP
jgi:hypothetical protein